MYTLPKAGPSTIVHLAALVIAAAIVFGKSAYQAVANRVK
jgi:hypothetical protein